MSNPVANPIVQNAQTNNAKYVSIIPENGTEFVSGQKIVFNLDPSLGWIKGRDSYIAFEILMNGAVPYVVSLQKSGISSIIKQVNIFSQHNGMLLETLDNYNQWVCAEAQYRHDDTTNLTNIEGFPKYIQTKTGFQADLVNVLAYHNLKNTYDDVCSHRLVNHEDDGTPKVNAVRFCTPLRCGIFRHWDTETLVPILQMGGLRIELVLADVLEVLDMPFVGQGVGQTAAPSGGHYAPILELTVNLLDWANGATEVEIGDTTIKVDTCGLVLGQTVHINNAADAVSVDKVITAIDQTGAGGATKITFVGGLGAAEAASTGILSVLPASITPNLSYKITGAEFRVLQEMPPSQKMTTTDYVFTSYDLFRDTIPQTQLNYNADITSVASKAVSLFTMYEDPQYDAVASFPHGHYYAGLNPDEAGVNMNSVVYFINNKLYPLRAYNPARYGDRVINQNEVVKAFGTLSIPVKCLGDGSNASLGNYTNRYLHARELARGQSVFNLQNAEPQIRVGFSAPRDNDKFGNQIGNIRMNTFVFSKKILHIDGDTGLTLEH